MTYDLDFYGDEETYPEGLEEEAVDFETEALEDEDSDFDAMDEEAAGAELDEEVLEFGEEDTVSVEK